MEIPFTTAYGAKLKVQSINNDPSMTKQSLKDDADVNKIIKRYNKTGVLPNMNKLEAVYGEITSQDLQDAINKVDASYEAFAEVPAPIRALFNNNAGDFIDYATNPQNIKQMTNWGLAKLPEHHVNIDGTFNQDGDITTGGEADATPNPVPNPA